MKIRTPLVSGTCKRCGKPLVSSNHSHNYPLKWICDDCVTPAEKAEILEHTANRILNV